MVSKVFLSGFMLLAIPLSANAATKAIECKLVNDAGGVQILKATYEESSDSAEVQLYSPDAECARDNSCERGTYKKEVLPSVIRLSSINKSATAAFEFIAEINRSTLAAKYSAHIYINNMFANSKTTDAELRGQCKASTVNSKNIL